MIRRLEREREREREIERERDRARGQSAFSNAFLTQFCSVVFMRVNSTDIQGVSPHTLSRTSAQIGRAHV